MTDECLLWTGHKLKGGYGYQVGENRKGFLVHRRIYELFMSVTPESIKDLHVCHRCDNPACWNPKHLFLGTRSDNMRDMVNKKRQWQQAKTHCKNGHEFVGENLMIVPGTRNKNSFIRACRTCRNERAKLRQREKRAANVSP